MECIIRNDAGAVQNRKNNRCVILNPFALLRAGPEPFWCRAGSALVIPSTSLRTSLNGAQAE